MHKLSGMKGGYAPPAHPGLISLSFARKPPTTCCYGRRAPGNRPASCLDLPGEQGLASGATCGWSAAGMMALLDSDPTIRFNYNDGNGDGNYAEMLPPSASA